MAKVELVYPAAIPATVRSGRGASREVAVLAAKDNLQKALRGTQALKIVPGAGERVAALVHVYKQAAKELGVGLAVVTSGRRSYRGKSGVEMFEATEIWVRVVKAAPAAAGTRQVPRRPVLAGPAKTTFEPITRCEISR